MRDQSWTIKLAPGKQLRLKVQRGIRDDGRDITLLTSGGCGEFMTDWELEQLRLAIVDLQEIRKEESNAKSVVPR